MVTQAFVYRLTEQSTGRWYIGSRTRQGCHPNDGYICSSREVLARYKANPQDWVRTIVEIGEPLAMRKLENFLLSFYDAANHPDSYNKHNGFGMKSFDKTGIKESDATRRKKSQAHMGKKRPDHAEKMRGRKRPDFALKMRGKLMGDKNPRAKTYQIIEPNGQIYSITSLKNFAEGLGKPVISAREMASGRYPNHTAQRGAWQGWTIKPVY